MLLAFYLLHRVRPRTPRVPGVILVKQMTLLQQLLKHLKCLSEFSSKSISAKLKNLGPSQIHDHSALLCRRVTFALIFTWLY